MSTTNDTYGTKNHKSVATATTESNLQSHYQQGGRYFLIDPDSGKSLNVSRLTAYAEHGDDIHGRVAHHEIPVLQIDAPRFLEPLTQEEHTRYHRQDPDPVEVDDFPLLRAGT